MGQPERVEEDDHAEELAPFVGLVRGVLASLVVWALLAAAVVAAYQLTPSWVAATVQTVLLDAR